MVNGMKMDHMLVANNSMTLLLSDADDEMAVQPKDLYPIGRDSQHEISLKLTPHLNIQSR